MSPFSIGIASGNESGVKWPAPFIVTTFLTKLFAFVIVILIPDLANKTFCYIQALPWHVVCFAGKD